jgi:hypothetical protein
MIADVDPFTTVIDYTLLKGREPRSRRFFCAYTIKKKRLVNNRFLVHFLLFIESRVETTADCKNKTTSVVHCVAKVFGRRSFDGLATPTTSTPTRLRKMRALAQTLSDKMGIEHLSFSDCEMRDGLWSLSRPCSSSTLG